MSRQQLKEKGFTIIEVVLVLAIAALIFLMVFIALPALQRNQRDQDRKTVVGKIASAVTEFQSNNRGEQPGTASDLSGYVDGKDDGSGNIKVNNEYVLVVSDGSGLGDSPSIGGAKNDVIQVYTGARCGENADINKAVSGTSRQAAVIVQLENGKSFFCQTI